MIDFTSKEHYDFEDLVRLVRLLREPGGCPWDNAQTHLSIRRNFLEEAYEACEGFDRDDPAIMCEELGDVLLQVLFHTDIEREAGRFTLEDVCDAVCKKLVFRHPFLFGGEASSWDEIKKKEKGQQTAAQSMDAVARSLPAAWRADKLLAKAAKSGVKSECISDCLDILDKEVNALRSAAEEGRACDDALGALLFAAVNAAFSLQVDPEDALHHSCERFIRRFAAEEQNTHSLRLMDEEAFRSLWEPPSSQSAPIKENTT